MSTDDRGVVRSSADVDLTVVGSGPNGLVAALVAARAGLRVRVFEATNRIGGAMATAELTLPGFRHDLGSAVHPAALASPAFRALGVLDRVPWVIPDASYAHPLDQGDAAIAWRDLARTADGLGADGPRWMRLLEPLVERIDGVVDLATSPLLRVPADPRAAARFAAAVIEQGGPWWNARFSGHAAPALLTGAIAHAAGGMPSLATAGAGVLLAAHGHAGGWGFPRGGAQSIADDLAREIRAHGGEIITGHRIRRLSEVRASRAVLLDTSPGLLTTAQLPPRYHRALERYRYGPGIAKVDFALAGPVPWRHPDIASTATVHLGGTRSAIARAERIVRRGGVPRHPFVLVTQPSLFDPTRAPAGNHTLWAYTHVPNGSSFDAAELVTRVIERSAPDFRERVLAIHSSTASDLAASNTNLVGGDLGAGAVSLRQLIARPVLSATPWRTPVDGVYLCSAATAPGPAVHGMNGWHAARLALRERFGIDVDRAAREP